MAHITASVEYGLHCLLWLVVAGDRPRSGPDLAVFQGISPAYVAKILVKLQKAGIVRSIEGISGGYVLARDPQQITVLSVVDAIEGRKPLFECQEIRRRCALFGSNPPDWATGGVCAVHASMLKAEKAMRDALGNETLAHIAQALGRNVPPSTPFSEPVKDWFESRSAGRGRGRGAARKDGRVQ